MALAFGLLALLIGCSPKLTLSGSDKALLPVSKDMPQDPEVLAYYAPYKKKIDSAMNSIIAVSAKEIQKGKPEAPLNNLMADAMYVIAKQKQVAFDIAYTNYGGLRIPLPKGDIPLYKVYELMPFENFFTTVKLKGPDMLAFFNWVAAMGGDPISGARFSIKDKKAVNITINGQAFDVNKEYIILTSDYMANGGDGGEVFSKGSERKEIPFKLRDALVEYLEQQTKAGKIIDPKNDGRITIE